MVAKPLYPLYKNIIKPLDRVRYPELRYVLALLVMTLFRLVEFIALHGMIVDVEASRVMAFVKGVWFDNVIACYISVLPVAVLLIAASLGWCHRRLLRGINIW